MFSRIQPSLRQVLRQPTRGFLTSARRNTAAVAEVADEADVEADKELAEHVALHQAQYAAAPKHGTVLYNWGAYPFYGLLGTTIISKELFILDHNFPAVGLFGATFVFFVWQLGPIVNKFLNTELLSKEQERQDTFDLIFALMDRTTSQIESVKYTPELLKEYVAEYKVAAEEASLADVRALKIEDYNTTVAQLETLANLKAAEASAAADLTDDVLQAHLYNVFADDEALVSKTIDEAIARLDPKNDSEGTIVRGIFESYVESGQFDFERIAAQKAVAAENDEKQK